jgi:hypothetical protein
MDIIPVLVSNIAMPSADLLPTSIQAIAYRNGIAIRPDPDFHKDAGRLVTALTSIMLGQIARYGR